LIDMKPLMHQDSRPKAKVEGALVLCWTILGFLKDQILGCLQGFFFLIFKIFFQFCNVAKLTGDHPQEDLAKFGYRPEMKMKNINR
jgi:hypothetical protein